MSAIVNELRVKFRFPARSVAKISMLYVPACVKTDDKKIAPAKDAPKSDGGKIAPKEKTVKAVPPKSAPEKKTPEVKAPATIVKEEQT